LVPAPRYGAVTFNLFSIEGEIQMRKILFFFVAVGLVAMSSSAQARLTKEWRTTLKPGTAWQIGCGYANSPANACPALSLYYFVPEGDEIAGDDVVVSMTYSQRRGWLAISPYEGQCVGGNVKVDGEERFLLESGAHNCVPQGGKPFQKESYTKRKPLPLGMFEQGEEMELTLQLKDGRTIVKTIPLAGFADKYNTLQQTSEAAKSSGRRR